jgi:amidohydrolase
MTAVDLTSVTERVVAWRRRLHQHPELGFAEHETAALVEDTLRSCGLLPRRVAGTGVVAVLSGASPGKTLLVRADMDALPIPERSGEPWASQIPGLMHACGHDAHTAMLLGAAVWLTAHRDRVAGSLVFAFQPAEEGPGGALPMIEAGVLSSPPVDAAIAMHVLPLLPPGVIGWKTGPVQAAADDFTIDVIGRGGHAASPHLAVDAIPAAAHLVAALQSLTSRESDPLERVVVGIGTMTGGFRRNAVADKVTLEGTVRCFDAALRAGMPQRLQRIAEGVCRAHGATCRIRYDAGYPPVINDPHLTRLAATVVERCPDVAGVVELPAPRMGAEDFAYFAQAVPGCMLRLGVAPEGPGPVAMLHAPEFRLNETALRAGVAAWCALALELPRML